jgi:hypothetical protein
MMVAGLIMGCVSPQSRSMNQTVNESLPVLSDEQLLDTIQLTTFRYFWDAAESVSGMARERYHMDDIYPQDDKNIVTSGGSGAGLMAIIIGIERGFVTRIEAIERLNKITSFLEKADRFHGAWPHWINGETGKTKPFSLKDDGGDIVETAYLVQGLLTVKQYLDSNDAGEMALRTRIDSLCNAVEWSWYQKNGSDVLYWHWSPKYGWEMNFPIEGYNECLIAYILGASSATFPITTDAYHKGWARNGGIKKTSVKYGLPLELAHNNNSAYGGPLFWSHYSYLGLNPSNLKDLYADYWQHNVNHVLIDRSYCIENPKKYKGYGKNCWGLTASYSIGTPGKTVAGENKEQDLAMNPDIVYNAHSPSNDHGVISPTAALSSFPYAPKECMEVARFLYDSLGVQLLGPYGFYDAFSLEYNWFPQRYLAIDQGPIIVMIENYRTGLPWELFMKNPEIQTGLAKLGFSF